MSMGGILFVSSVGFGRWLTSKEQHSGSSGGELLGGTLQPPGLNVLTSSFTAVPIEACYLTPARLG